MPPKRVRRPRRTLLASWISRLRAGEELILDRKDIGEFIKTNLDIPLDGLDDQLQQLLFTMIVIYMERWMESHPNSKQNTRQLLIQHLKGKARRLMATFLQFPFSVSIGCPPELMNELLFIPDKDDVICTVENSNPAPAPKLKLSQLLNWPFVEVHFMTPVFKFSRKLVPIFRRYLSVGDVAQTASSAAVEAKLKATDIVPFSLICTFIQEYLRQIKMIPEVDMDRFDELEVVLDSFLTDLRMTISFSKNINETNPITLTLGCGSLYYNITKNKSSDSNEPQSEICYWEFLTPKVKLCLDLFKRELAFSWLTYLQNSKNLNDALPKITYKCSMCGNSEFPVCFVTQAEALEHFQNVHKMAEEIDCMVCNKMFNVCSLTEKRWEHSCTK